MNPARPGAFQKLNSFERTRQWPPPLSVPAAVPCAPCSRFAATRPALPETCCGWRPAVRPAHAYAVIGTIGLTAIAIALVGPKRLERDVLKPLQKAVGPQAEKLWDQARPVREQLTGLFRRAGDQQEKLARDFQSWIGHFRAS